MERKMSLLKLDRMICNHCIRGHRTKNKQMKADKDFYAYGIEKSEFIRKRSRNWGH